MYNPDNTEEKNSNTPTTIILDRVLFEKYGGKDKLNLNSIIKIEQKFIEMFPRTPDPPLVTISRIFNWILGIKTRFTKKELAQILVTNKVVNNISQALEIVDEMIEQRKFAKHSADEHFRFEHHPQEDGTILYSVNHDPGYYQD